MISESITHEYVSAEIAKLIGQYGFPIHVLQDVNGRLRDSDDPNYAAQQLRYLNNIVAAGRVRMKNE